MCVRGTRVLSPGCMVYKQTQRKQSSEECGGVGGVDIRGQGLLSLSPPRGKKTRGGGKQMK